jgi:hypothetical protein
VARTIVEVNILLLREVTSVGVGGRHLDNKKRGEKNGVHD